MVSPHLLARCYAPVVERVQSSGEFARTESIAGILQDALKIVNAAKAEDASTVQKQTGDCHKIMNTDSTDLSAFAAQTDESKRLIFSLNQFYL